MYQRALAAVQVALNPMDPELTIYLANLAGVYQVCEQVWKSVFYRDTNVSCLTSKGPMSPSLILRSPFWGPIPLPQLPPLSASAPPSLTAPLSSLRPTQDLRRFSEAEDMQRKAISICERSLGRDHPMTASVLSNLAEMLGQQGKLEEAEMLARDVLQV